MEPLLVLLALLASFALEEAPQQQYAVMEKFLMLMRQVAFGTDRPSAQLVHISTHLPQLLVHIVLLVLQATRALEVQLLQLLVLPVKL